jgi:hypothetical protein
MWSASSPRLRPTGLRYFMLNECMTLSVAIIDYVVLVGTAQVALSAVWGVCAIALLATRGRGWLFAHLKRLALFNVTFFVWGIIVFTACHSATWGRFYESCDFVLDWQPFIPFCNWLLQQTFGGVAGRLLPGATMTGLQALWCVAAVVTWCGTAFTFKRLALVFETRVP